jgi:hypothetical protein
VVRAPAAITASNRVAVRGVDPGEDEAMDIDRCLWTLVRKIVDSGEQKRQRINESPHLSRGLG